MSTTDLWQQAEPEHFKEIAAATESLLSAINRLTCTTGDTMVEAAATHWVIDQLTAFQNADLEADLTFRPVIDDD